MKKILLTLILLILFIPGVNAEVDETCEELLPNYPDDYKLVQNGTSYYIWYQSTELRLNLKAGESYTFFYNNADVDMSNYDFKLNSTIHYSLDTSNQYYHVYTINTDISPTFFTKTYTILPENLIFHLVKGTEPCGIISGSDDNQESISSDTTLDSFYTLYIDKLKSLASYSLENKFILGAIGIIFLFAILEIILNLFNRGGYRR